MDKAFKLRNGTLLLSTEAPGGIYNSAQLKKIAALSDEDSAIVKVTEDQRLALFVTAENAEKVASELKAIGLGIRHYQQGLHQPTSCIGEQCPDHLQDALGAAMQITEDISGHQFDNPLKIGVNGCSKCCVPCHTLDISVVGDEHGYRVHIGGKSSQIPEMATFMAEGIPADKISSMVQSIVALYKEHAQPGDSLQDVMERIGAAPFAEVLAPYSQDSAHGMDDMFTPSSEELDEGSDQQMLQNGEEDSKATDDQEMESEAIEEDEQFEPGPGIEQEDELEIEESVITDSSDEGGIESGHLNEDLVTDEQNMPSEEAVEVVSFEAEVSEEEESSPPVVEGSSDLCESDDMSDVVDHEAELEMTPESDEGLVEAAEDGLEDGGESDASMDSQNVVLEENSEELDMVESSTEVNEPAAKEDDSIINVQENVDFEDELENEQIAQVENQELLEDGVDSETSENMEHEELREQADDIDTVSATDDNIEDTIEDEVISSQEHEEVEAPVDEPQVLAQEEVSSSQESEELELIEEPVVDNEQAQLEHEDDSDLAIEQASAIDQVDDVTQDLDTPVEASEGSESFETEELEAQRHEDEERDLEMKIDEDIRNSEVLNMRDENKGERDDVISMVEGKHLLGADKLSQISGVENASDPWSVEKFDVLPSGNLSLEFKTGARIELNPLKIADNKTIKLGNKTFKVSEIDGQLSVDLDEGLTMILPLKSA